MALLDKSGRIKVRPEWWLNVFHEFFYLASLPKPDPANGMSTGSLNFPSLDVDSVPSDSIPYLFHSIV